MTPHQFTEDQLVEKPAIELFEQLEPHRLNENEPEVLEV